ncbi:hypothetical protein [Escherichia coli]|uniref:hypothetical protein n=1 Tax=Escherichia coli TaxID=562 RepID=UPI003F66EFBC
MSTAQMNLLISTIPDWHWPVPIRCVEFGSGTTSWFQGKTGTANGTNGFSASIAWTISNQKMLAKARCRALTPIALQLHTMMATGLRANPVSGQLLWQTQMNFTTSTGQPKSIETGIWRTCSWTYLNGAPFGGFQQVHSDQNKVWYVNNYAWGNYESGGTITVTCLNLPGAGI